MKQFLLLLAFVIFFGAHYSSNAAVILQYHHVSDSSPASTSISPKQFAAHMQYLADNSYRVIPLSELIEQIKNKQEIPDKTVVITFDDAYTDILEQGKPILDKYNYPFTIFMDPGIINQGSKHYLSWQQLKAMAEDDVIIANHGFNHDSWARTPSNLTDKQWVTEQMNLLLKAEEEISKHTGQKWKYFAYPYGEYTAEIQSALTEQGFVAFAQQSGAVGLQSDLSALSRFPASQPYDKLTSLKDKLASLPFTMSADNKAAKMIFEVNALTSATFSVEVKDFPSSQLNCYVTGLGKQPIEWLSNDKFTIEFTSPLPTGRIRSNCTAPSISKPGRYYWFSKQWFILKEGMQWYPL